jgi:hypothetical protein
MTTPAFRPFVIPADEAPVAVIIRRGPSDWFHLTRWDMEHDRFQSGAWPHGRLYPEKCDISPDGSLFRYSAYNPIRVGGKRVNAYTALGRTPWLHALVIWP